MSLTVTHFMRRPSEAGFSLENVFRQVRLNLPTDIETRVYTCRFGAKGFLGRLYEMVRVCFFKSSVNHVTGDFYFLSYLLPRSCTLLTIHDTVSLDNGHGLKKELIKLFWYWIPEKRSQLISVVSHETKRRLLNHLKCDPNKIRVIYNPIGNEFVRKEFRKKDRPRILLVGTGWNKNIERVLEALQGVACDVSILGKLSPLHRAALDKYKLSYDVQYRLSEEQMAREYELSDLVVFPSLYEGFGLPIIEGQAVGRPVVTSNIEPMLEVAGSGACFVDPLDVASIREGILKVLGDTSYRDSLVTLGLENIKRFSAQAIAESYAALYRELAKA